MNLERELEYAFERASTVPHDLKDQKCKSLCDELWALSWKVVRAKTQGAGISEVICREALCQTESFPPLNSRVYELSWLYKLASIMFRGDSELKQALQALRAESTTNTCPIKPNLILQGLCEYKLHGLGAAQYYFLRANQEYMGGSVVTPFFSYSRSVSVIPSLDQMERTDSDGSESGAARVGGPTRSMANNGNVWILVSANSAYIGRFLRNYVDSIRSQPHEVALHAHWIEDTEDSATTLLAQDALNYARQQLDGRFESSKETCPAIKDKRSYYACSRFSIAKGLLQRKGRLIITDIDYQVVGDLSAFSAWCDQYDVCLQVTEDGVMSCFPWLKVCAGTVVLANSAMSRLFLDMFAHCFSRTYVSFGYNWGIDQNILCALYDELNHLGFIGNSRQTKNPFTVPLDLKQGMK